MQSLFLFYPLVYLLGYANLYSLHSPPTPPCTIMHCTILHSTIPHCIILHSTMLPVKLSTSRMMQAVQSVDNYAGQAGCAVNERGYVAAYQTLQTLQPLTISYQTLQTPQPLSITYQTAQTPQPTAIHYQTVQPSQPGAIGYRLSSLHSPGLLLFNCLTRLGQAIRVIDEPAKYLYCVISLT